MSYTVRKVFTDEGKKFFPGEILEDSFLDHFPRPESMIRGGWLVKSDKPVPAKPITDTTVVDVRRGRPPGSKNKESNDPSIQ